jgi:predicted transposase YbfD/YdcC
METPSISDLKELINQIEDPRVEGRSQHPLVNILLIGLATVLCGGESFSDMERFADGKRDFFGKHLDMSGGAPSHDTFQRVFEAMEPEQLGDILLAWTAPVRAGQVAIDGKSLRASRRGENRPLHLINAYAKERGLVLGQMIVDGKTNEITALPNLIRSLDLEGCTVSIDAMGCQKNIAKEIVEADADYVLALKANQGIAHAEIASFLDAEIKEGRLRCLEEADKGHGRHEVRRYWQSESIGWFAEGKAWEALHTVAVVEQERTLGAKTTVERRYFLSSLPVDLPRLASVIRGHWSVESLHWTLDVTFGEDRSQTSHKTSAQNMALLRRLALNILKQDASIKDAIRGKRLRAGWNDSYLARLLNFDA